MNVVDLGGCRDLLKDWEAVRQHILQGGIKGGALCLRGQSGKETIFLFGTHKTDAEAALKAGMRMSWEMTDLGEMEPLQASSGR